MRELIQYKKGDKFGDITFIEEDFHEKEVTGYQTHRKAVAECFCGRKFITRISGLKNGRVSSCGCRRRDGHIKRITRHNMSSSKEYSSWESMKARCLNSNNLFYNNYGGRGIKVCKRWLNFKNFYKDMGDKPSKDYSLERIDVNGNYCPKNCKWATRREQDRNRRTNVFIEYKNKTYILSDLAKKVGLHQQTIKSRLDRGLPMEEVVSKNYNYTKS